MECICKACVKARPLFLCSKHHLSASSISSTWKWRNPNKQQRHFHFNVTAGRNGVCVCVFLSFCERVCSGPFLSCAVSDKRTMAAKNATPAGGTACMVEHIWLPLRRKPHSSCFGFDPYSYLLPSFSRFFCFLLLSPSLSRISLMFGLNLRWAAAQ